MDNISTAAPTKQQPQKEFCRLASNHVASKELEYQLEYFHFVHDLGSIARSSYPSNLDFTPSAKGTNGTNFQLIH